MLALPGALRRSMAEIYLAGTAALTHRLLRGRSGPRDFRRVVVVAPLGRNNGIASGAHLQWRALRQLGVETELLDATPALRNPLFRVPHQPGSAYIFHAAGPQAANLIGSVLPHAAEAWRVGYWAWELPDPPPGWAGCDRTLCEIWTPSRFARDSLVRLVDRPIHVVPHHVPARPAGTRTMGMQREARPFTVLVMADSRSSLSRKNPDGALRAFRAAFGFSPAARLVLKLNGSAGGADAGSQALFAGDVLSGGNVEVVSRFLDADALDELFRGADVLLSLHRAEGFGIPMLEAMAHGVPVVATGWSGNLEFMDETNSHLVPYQLVPVRDAASIYSGSTWAEPDIHAAAQALRRLADDPAHCARMASAAHRRARALAPRFPFAPAACETVVAA